MKKIALSQGIFAIVDEEDYKKLNQWKWSAAKRGPRCKGFYAFRQEGPTGKRRTILMHRQIMNTPKGMDTDHINGDGLDNRKSNLRVTDRTQNNYNIRQLRVNNTSGYRGVSWFKPAKLWRAYIGGSKTRKELGYYKNIEDAIKARIDAEKLVIL